MTPFSRQNPVALATAWKAARRLAVAPYVGPAAGNEDEWSWIRAVPKENRAPLLGDLYAKCRQAGEDLRARLAARLSVGEIAYLLSRAEVPCFEGRWKAADRGLACTHCTKTCPYVENSFECDYWREAARGLVAGLSETAVMARHASLGHKQNECVDVLYEWPAADRRYGPVPKKIQKALAPLLEDLNRWHASIELAGFAEGTLYYRIVGEHFPACEPCRALAVAEMVRLTAPVDRELRIREAPPLPESPEVAHARTDP